MDEETRTFIIQARRMASYGRYHRAFELYLTAFERSSIMKPYFEVEFRVILIRFNEILASFNKMDQVFSNFELAINAFPGSAYLSNDIGKYLYKFGFCTLAWRHFQRALKINAGYVNAEKNLNSIKNFLVERWHYRMLNDRIRNEAYHAAIVETVIPGRDLILDIGTGTGLLALYANECTPLGTVGCESSDVMAQLAQFIMRENDATEIAIIHKMSTDLEYREIGGKQTLIVTELFDSGLLGEHVLQALSHAWKNLMTESGRIIPNRAEFFIVAAKCDHLAAKYQLLSPAKVLLNIPNTTVHMLSSGETYDCEDVHLFNNMKYMTDAHSIFTIDFNNYEDIQNMLTRCEPFNINLEAKESGEINLIIGWFNLHLTENIMITTNPAVKNRANAWQQTVFYDFIAQDVQQNEVIDIQFLVNGGKMTLLQANYDHIMRLSAKAIKFLNDYDYTKKIKDSIAGSFVHLAQMSDISQVNIVDLCPFPLFGLLMMKRGARSLVCWAKTKSDKIFFKKVFKINRVRLSKVTILLDDKWTRGKFRDHKYHAIVYNPFELCGDIDFLQKDTAEYLKRKHFHQGGLFMPAQIELIGQLVDSEWLDNNNRVNDENVTNYKISFQMNRFQVSQNYCLDLSTLSYNPLSDPISLGTYDSEFDSDVFNVQIIKDGETNAVLFWYSIELLETFENVQTNRSNSFINGMAFLADPKLPVSRGGTANILRCVDHDGSFKLIIDVESD